MSTNMFCAKVRAMHERPSVGVFEFEIEFDVNLERW